MIPSSIIAPFTKGMITDAPAHLLQAEFSPYAQDGFSPRGMFKMRQGWAYDGTTTDVGSALSGIYRNRFILADVTRTITTDYVGGIYIHNPSSSGTTLKGTGSDPDFLPRAIYQDEMILCAQDGQTPLQRYSGSAVTSSGIAESSGSPTYTSGQATITGMTYASTPTAGSYVQWAVDGTNYPGFRILEGSTTSVTLEGVVAASTTGSDQTIILPTCQAFPSVVVYNAGTVTVSSGTATGYGTKWSSGASYSQVFGDHIVVMADGVDAESGFFSESGATTASTTVADQATKSSYAITRRLPFKDVANHKGSLWGTGVIQYPSRVYVGPPGWNLSFPPGFVLPVDPLAAITSSNANDFFMDFIDVPNSYDGDDVIAILSSPNPLLVLKREAVYGIYGSFPNFSVDMIADGIGCIDIRSAQSFDEGQFWCGEAGIYWYTNGQIVDLTAGRINREWRALTRDFVYGTDYCSVGISQGHLIVHITTNNLVTQRTYLCDLRSRSWQSRISNFTPNYQYTSRISTEAEKLLCVSTSRPGRVINFSPALDGSGTASDDAGTAPRLQAYTPEGIDGGTIDDDTRMLDLAVHANVYDVATGLTQMSVSVVTSGALTNPTAATTSLATISSDSIDSIDRHYYRHVDKRGRRHQVRLAVTSLGSDNNSTKVEIEQINATFRPTRNRT